MVNPVPGYSIGTPYLKRGSKWGCNPNASGGVHTGVDYPAPKGARVVAARPGIVRHVSFGSAFGTKQIEVVAGDGTSDFYAHMSSRVANGTQVASGEKVGEVGSEGNVTGPHLHFERHRNAGSWSCTNHVDPKSSIEYEEVPVGEVYLSHLQYGERDSTSVRRLQDVLNRHSLAGGSTLPVTGNYSALTDHEVRLCQRQHGFGNDSPGESYVGPKQAEHLFAGSAHIVIDDVTQEPPPPTDPIDPEPPEEIVYPLGIEYHYSGKPSGSLKVGASYRRLDVPAWAPKRDGYVFSMLYVNATPTFDSGKDAGEFRVRMDRLKPVDSTAYQSFTVHRDALIGGNYLITHMHFGKFDAGRPMEWYMRSADGLGDSTIGTRYAKHMLIPESVVIELLHVVQFYSRITAPFRWLSRLIRHR